MKGKLLCVLATPLSIAALSCPAFSFSKKHVIEVPFEFEHNQVILQVRINNRGPFNILLDTGAYPSIIDIALAKQIGLPVEPIKRQGTGVGTEEIVGYKTNFGQLEIGKLLAKDILAVAVDLSKSAKRLGKPLHGVLGYNFLENRLVQIDYPKRKVRFYDVSPFSKLNSQEDNPNRLILPMKFNKDDTIPVIEEFYVNGKKIRVILDTGSSLTLTLFPAAIKYLDLEEDAKNAEVDSAVGAGGKVEIRNGHVQSLAIGKIVLKANEVAFGMRGYGEKESLDVRGGSLGNGALEEFVLTLDYLNKEIIFERHIGD